MRTRSRASLDTLDQAGEKKGAAKRKRTNDDSDVGNAESTIKRSRTQFCAAAASAGISRTLRVKSPSKAKGHNSAGPERPAEGPSASRTSNIDDDEAFAMTLGTFVGAIRKRGAADESSQKSTCDKPGASLKKPITRKQGAQASSSLISPEQSCDDTRILCDGPGTDGEDCPEGGALKGSDNVTPTQEVLVTHCNSGFGKNVHTTVMSTHYGQDGLQIGAPLLTSQEVTCRQYQSHEDGSHGIADADVILEKSADADATLVKKKSDNWSSHKKRRTFLGGHRTTSSKRRLGERHLSCPFSGKSEGDQGYMERFENQGGQNIGLMLPAVPQQVNVLFSHRRLNAAKSRWKNLAHSILRNKIYPERLASASGNQLLTKENVPDNDSSYRRTDVHSAKSRPKKTASRPKKPRKRSTAANSSRARLQRVRNWKLSLLKRMKTWLAEAKFSQNPKQTSNNDTGKEVIITEDERCAFARSMEQSCQKNPKMRMAFLESVRRLTLSGLMQAAATNLLQQGPCEEAQVVMDAWAEFQEQNARTKTLPLNLLSAVNQLHEKRGDLFTKLSNPNKANICALSQIDEKTWKFQLPSPGLKQCLQSMEGQDTTV